MLSSLLLDCFYICHQITRSTDFIAGRFKALHILKKIAAFAFLLKALFTPHDVKVLEGGVSSVTHLLPAVAHFAAIAVERLVLVSTTSFARQSVEIA